jgi:transposase
VHSPGRDFYDRQHAEGHTPREAIRALKRRISNIVYSHLIADATGTSVHTITGPGGQPVSR